MIINDKTIKNLGNLAKLEIDENKVEDLKIKLSEILSFVDNLQEVDLDNLDAIDEDFTPLRADSSTTRDEVFHRDILINAPKSKDGYFVVPKIIE